MGNFFCLHRANPSSGARPEIESCSNAPPRIGLLSHSGNPTGQKKSLDSMTKVVKIDDESR
ncbi:Uncharacterised protein [Porphyromonas cangingivalis]|nr:Uncharacterised protein [Porphyromonas cangingivalis]